MKEELIIACPKGRLENKVVKYLSDRGLKIEDAFFDDNTRKLTFDTNFKEVKIIKLKPSDIRSYTILGAADIGFVGYDDILENSEKNLVLLNKTNIGKCRISIASDKKKINFSEKKVFKVATKFQNISENYFKQLNIQTETIKLNGSIELAVKYGVADFIAAEEMGRRRGYWWSPEGNRLLVTEVDESDVVVWHILNSSDPSSQPRTLRYPKAGTNNPYVGLSIYALDGDVVPIDWTQKNFWEYLVNVQWTEESEIYLTVQNRNQTSMGILRVDSVTGDVEEIYRWTDEYWVEIISGAPKVIGEHIVTVEDRGEARALVVDNVQISSSDIQIRSLIHCDNKGVVTAVSENPLEQHIMHFDLDGKATQLSKGAGVHDAVSNGSLTVIQSRSMDFDGVQTSIYIKNVQIAEVEDRSENPVITLNTNFHTLGERSLETVVLFPLNHDNSTPLPVILDPYGGPHAQRVRSARGLFGVSQWFADQGFAVIVTDGRGTPGRSPAFERDIYGDLASAALEDQIDALQATASIYDQLDLGRVGIRGWSFGGYLAALAVLRRPDIFHAGVAGAPVTDWELYDTHYTERYLGHPLDNPENYQKTNLCNEAHKLDRPLLLIHGLADDNVVAAHTFQLSQALLEAGKPHEVLPLTGVTHMTPQETVAENLLRIQLSFIQRSLGIKAEGNE